VNKELERAWSVAFTTISVWEKRRGGMRVLSNIRQSVRKQ
jgi:hypothetical protein